MAQPGQLGHDGFAQHFSRARRRAGVENLAAGFDQPGAVLAGWRASTAHHAHLLQPQIRLAGSANVDGYITLPACEGAAGAVPASGNQRASKRLNSAAPAQTRGR